VRHCFSQPDQPNRVIAPATRRLYRHTWFWRISVFRVTLGETRFHARACVGAWHGFLTASVGRGLPEGSFWGDGSGCFAPTPAVQSRLAAVANVFEGEAVPSANASHETWLLRARSDVEASACRSTRHWRALSRRPPSRARAPSLLADTGGTRQSRRRVDAEPDAVLTARQKRPNESSSSAAPTPVCATGDA